MKLAILVALVRRSDETERSARHAHQALAKPDFGTDKQAKAALETVNKDLAEYIEKFQLADKAALPKQARIRELNGEEELLGRPHSDDEPKPIRENLKPR